MKAISKALLLARLEAQIEVQLQTVTGRFQNLNEAQLLKPAAGGGWSMIQCLEHLNSYGRYYLPAIAQGLQHSTPGSSAAATFSSTWLGNYFTRIMQPGNTGKKYKAPKDHTPSREQDSTKVISEFIRQQEQLLDLVRSSAPYDLNKVRIPISISRWIRLRLGDVFQFLLAHNERHLQQALRQLEQV